MKESIWWDIETEFDSFKKLWKELKEKWIVWIKIKDIEFIDRKSENEDLKNRLWIFELREILSNYNWKTIWKLIYWLNWNKCFLYFLANVNYKLYLNLYFDKLDEWRIVCNEVVEKWLWTKFIEILLDKQKIFWFNQIEIESIWFSHWFYKKTLNKFKNEWKIKKFTNDNNFFKIEI